MRATPCPSLVKRRVVFVSLKNANRVNRVRIEISLLRFCVAASPRGAQSSSVRAVATRRVRRVDARTCETKLNLSSFHARLVLVAQFRSSSSSSLVRLVQSETRRVRLSVRARKPLGGQVLFTARTVPGRVVDAFATRARRSAENVAVESMSFPRVRNLEFTRCESSRLARLQRDETTRGDSSIILQSTTSTLLPVGARARA